MTCLELQTYTRKPAGKGLAITYLVGQGEKSKLFINTGQSNIYTT